MLRTWGPVQPWTWHAWNMLTSSRLLLPWGPHASELEDHLHRPRSWRGRQRDCHSGQMAGKGTVCSTERSKLHRGCSLDSKLSITFSKPPLAPLLVKCYICSEDSEILILIISQCQPWPHWPGGGNQTFVSSVPLVTVINVVMVCLLSQ